MTRAFIGIGSNLGDRAGYLKEAIALLSSKSGEIALKSSVYESAAWGMGTAPSFLNMVIAVDTSLSPEALLLDCHAIERELGRERKETHGYQSRTLDLDILLHGNEEVNEPELTLPHPGLEKRRFVLMPLAEIAPALKVPGSGITIEVLLERCEDETKTEIWTSPTATSV